MQRVVLLATACGVLALTDGLATGVASSARAGSQRFSPAVRKEAPVTSANWAGYVARRPLASTRGGFTHVSAIWNVPTARCGGGASVAAFWVGLGGFAKASRLEQVGITVDCSRSGQPDHYAWYELPPRAPVRLPIDVNAGTVVAAAVTVNKRSTVSFTLWNLTAGTRVSKDVRITSSEFASAEWIAEAPYACNSHLGCQPLSLTDFGSLTFRSARASLGEHEGSITDSHWTVIPVHITSIDKFATDRSSTGFRTAGSSSARVTTRTAGPTALFAGGHSFAVVSARVSSKSGALVCAIDQARCGPRQAPAGGPHRATDA